MTQTVSEPHAGREMYVRCRGCREITVPTDPPPSPFRGLIELDGQPIPVMDPTARFSAEETQVSDSSCIVASDSSCIVVIDREYESQRVRIGVIVGDIDEVMQLAAGVGTASAGAAISVNMDLIVRMFDTSNPQELLAEHYHEFELLDAVQNHTGAVSVPA